jgi:uncharacterized membrane protein
MVGVQNVATGYCQIKQYIILFMIFLVLIGTVYLLMKKPIGGQKKNNTVIMGFGGVLSTFLVVYYFILKTTIGCDVSIGVNAVRAFK